MFPVVWISLKTCWRISVSSRSQRTVKRKTPIVSVALFYELTEWNGQGETTPWASFRRWTIFKLSESAYDARVKSFGVDFQWRHPREKTPEMRGECGLTRNPWVKWIKRTLAMQDIHWPDTGQAIRNADYFLFPGKGETCLGKWGKSIPRYLYCIRTFLCWKYTEQ